MKPYGLILAGGGGKGAYQIGAWKAMRELGVKFSAIAGVSIGSINGALIASDKYNEAMKMWTTVTLDKGVKIESELKDTDNLFSVRNYPVLLKEFLKKGGIDASPTKDFLGEFIDEKAVRDSKIPLGIVTYQLSSMNPLELFIEDIPEGELIDYLLASSKFPGVSRIGPEGEHFLDGGVYDNAPVSMLKKRGYNRLIVVDISSIKGYAHEQNFSCAQVVYIRPYEPDELGAAFDFSPEEIEKRMTMGYLDAKKAFGKYAGTIYYFKPLTFKTMIRKYGCDTVAELEQLAYALNMPRLKVYKENEFLKELKHLYDERDVEQEDEDEEPQGFIETLVKRFSDKRTEKEDFEKAEKLLEEMKS